MAGPYHVTVQCTVTSETGETVASYIWMGVAETTEARDHVNDHADGAYACGAAAQRIGYSIKSGANELFDAAGSLADSAASRAAGLRRPAAALVAAHEC